MNKQIEEMATIALNITMSHTCAKQIAINLYNAGYRKQDEVAREIFAEIEQAIFAHGTKYAMKRLEELKKKYEVMDE